MSNELYSMEELKGLIKSYPNFPIEGINFFDIHPILSNPKAFKSILNHLNQRYKDMKVDAILGLESRGYYFGITLAYLLNVPFVPIRKAGKLPGPCKQFKYELEYGHAIIEIQENALGEGSHVVIIDDLLATGGTASAACSLVKELNVNIVEFFVIIELIELQGVKKMPKDIKFNSFIHL